MTFNTIPDLAVLAVVRDLLGKPNGPGLNPLLGPALGPFHLARGSNRYHFWYSAWARSSQKGPSPSLSLVAGRGGYGWAVRDMSLVFLGYSCVSFRELTGDCSYVSI